MKVTIASSDIARLKAAIENTGRKLRKELVIATNQTARKGKSIIAKEIGKESILIQRDIKRVVDISRRANAGDISATVIVNKEKRLNLKSYKARQVKKGISFKISKTKGTFLDPGAFIVPGWFGGNVYKRQGKGRGPLIQRRGISPWGTFTSGGKIGPSATQIEAELKKNIDRRIRFIALKASGAI